VMTDSVTELGSGAFMECYNLEEVVLSDNIKEFGSYTFEMCFALKKLNIPNSLERVYSIAFSGCASLTELVFPESVEVIEGYTQFNSALSLKKWLSEKIPDHMMTTMAAAVK
ncbi:MAG: leucine-rich repeat domain-containing protein, partial [Clostridia bacterium]|nr:leucine-rich repeat domain-containing protein [Clostridia bacterium]